MMGLDFAFEQEVCFFMKGGSCCSSCLATKRLLVQFIAMSRCVPDQDATDSRKLLPMSWLLSRHSAEKHYTYAVNLLSF